MEISAEQHRAALDWIDLSSLLRKNRHQAQQTELVAELKELASEHQQRTAQREKLMQLLAGAEAELQQAEAAVETKSAAIAAEEAKLNAGTGLTSKDLLALQGDIEVARTKLDELEETQLEAMDKRDQLLAKKEALEARAREIAARGKELQEQRKATAAQLDAEAADLTAQLGETLQDIGPELGPKISAAVQRGSAGIAVIRAGACGACGNGLSGSVLNEIAQSSATAVFQCEDCEAFLIKA